MPKDDKQDPCQLAEKTILARVKRTQQDKEDRKELTKALVEFLKELDKFE